MRVTEISELFVQGDKVEDEFSDDSTEAEKTIEPVAGVHETDEVEEDKVAVKVSQQHRRFGGSYTANHRFSGKEIGFKGIKNVV